MAYQSKSLQKKIVENFRQKDDFTASHQLLQARLPHRENFSTPPRGRKEAGRIDDWSQSDESPPSVIKQLALLSPKFLVDGIQRLRDITEASSLRFSDDLDESSILDNSVSPPETLDDLLLLITIRQREEMITQLCISASAVNSSQPAGLLAKATAIAQQAVKSWRSISGESPIPLIDAAFDLDRTLNPTNICCHTRRL
jgi:hypothetical protein